MNRQLQNTTKEHNIAHLKFSIPQYLPNGIEDYIDACARQASEMLMQPVACPLLPLTHASIATAVQQEMGHSPSKGSAAGH